MNIGFGEAAKEVPGVDRGGGGGETCGAEMMGVGWNFLLKR